MAKKKTQEKKLVTKSENDTSNEVAMAIQDFTEMLHGLMSIDMIIEKAKLIKQECGGDAKLAINDDEYYGSSASLQWTRLETDKEFEKRLERSTKAKIAGAASAKIRREQKRVDELKELARLQKKYSGGK